MSMIENAFAWATGKVVKGTDKGIKRLKRRRSITKGDPKLSEMNTRAKNVKEEEKIDDLKDGVTDTLMK